jgi:putative intracellular protease/amidase
MTFLSTYRATSIALTLFAAAWAAPVARADQLPVLMVIANQDFYYQEYASVRKALESRGMQVVVAAGTTADAVPQGKSGFQWLVHVDRTLAAVSAADYSAIVFVGGWGASSYQYAFAGTYYNPAYRPDPVIVAEVNRVIGDFVVWRKAVGAVSHGVAVIAWARVDGVSPLAGRKLVGWAGGGPGFTLNGHGYANSTVPVRWHVEANGGSMLLSSSVGDPLVSTDDVWVDGKIITAENFNSAAAFAKAIIRSISQP